MLLFYFENEVIEVEGLQEVRSDVQEIKQDIKDIRLEIKSLEMRTTGNEKRHYQYQQTIR